MIKHYIKTSQSPFIVQLRNSIKTIEIEETMDLLLHRPIGLVMSWGAVRLGLKPVTISLMGLCCGIIAGVFYVFQDQLLMVILAGLFLELSGILDTVDGQVARMTNQSSELGMIIDGAMDTLVFTSVYIGSTVFHFKDYGWWILLLAAVSGFLHSLQSMIFEYYKNEFSFLYAGKKPYRNKTVDEARLELQEARGFMQKILRGLHLDYVRKQNFLTNRKGEIKQRFESLAFDPEKKEDFKVAYKNTYAPFLTSWALFGGSNIRRTLIIVLCFFHWFDIYLLINIALGFPLLLTGILQAKADRKLLATFDHQG